MGFSGRDKDHRAGQGSVCASPWERHPEQEQEGQPLGLADHGAQLASQRLLKPCSYKICVLDLKENANWKKLA